MQCGKQIIILNFNECDIHEQFLSQPKNIRDKLTK